MAPLYPYELGVLLTSIVKCDNATYRAYRADDLTRYVKQVDLRWLFVSIWPSTSYSQYRCCAALPPTLHLYLQQRSK
jgi:hypothetical protein